MLPRMTIYDKDDRTIVASVPITKDAVHEEELMASNLVRLSWYDKKCMTLPVGAYVVPFSDGVKYRLFDPYTPKSEKHRKYKYEPEFQHPVMWLGRIPFIHLEGDTQSWDTAVKRYDWTFSGPPTEIAERIVRYINWLSTVVPSFGEVFGTGWTKRVEGDLSPNVTCSFSTVDILSAASEVASNCGGEYHFDFRQKVFHLGKIDYDRYGDTPYELKCGSNVGVVSVSETKEEYANCFIVSGGTRNLSKLDSDGGYVQVTQRLTLDEKRFPDSVIDLRGGSSEPMLVRQLVFDDIYPKLELYIYNPRERVCWMLDGDGNRVEDENGTVDPADGKKYKVYSKWYVRLAYLSDGEWKDYELTDERKIKDKKPMISFEVNPDYHTYDSALAGKEFEVVYFDKDTEENAENVNGTFTAHAGDYRIEFIEQDNVVIPTSKAIGMCPKGGVTPDKANNKASLYNVVVDDAYKEVAREELYNEAMRSINRLRSDLNTYTFPSNPITFKYYNPNLYIGQSVVYDDGQDLTGGTSYRLRTHVRKLVTRLDRPYIQTITVGNEKRKGSVSSIKEQVESFISGGYGSGSGGSGSGVGGTTLTEAQFEQLISNYGSEYFLSKVEDDRAQGLIGLLKGVWFGVRDWFIDKSGNANLNDVAVNGLLKAYNAMINNARSTNYTGDGLLDTGWRITNEYEGGNSKATFDYLYIRKKATFEELEIRRLSHIGGNFCLSGASGRAWKVEYYRGDAESGYEEMGYEEKTVPWTLAGRILMLFSKSAANRYLGHRKTVQRRLTPSEMGQVTKVRVYMYNDDGQTETTGTRNIQDMMNWTVGAQARCQTYNVRSQMEFDGSSWKGTKTGNTYWWRMVTAVGQETLPEDGKVHDWVEFLVDHSREGTAYAYADAGSDLPSKGDVFVQMGHRTDALQANVIMLETANSDSPAIKMYEGVNWWTLDGKEVAKLTPRGWEVYADHFKWITRYGEAMRPMVNRGAWVEIVPDSEGDRRCYYNDLVSHNGSYWRCIVAEGSYTTDEPSESSSAWQKDVSAGIAPYVKLSDSMVAVPCEKGGTATSAFSAVIVPKLMVTNLECQLTSVTVGGSDSNVRKDSDSNNILVSFSQGAVVPNKDYTITLEGDYGGNHYTATAGLSVYGVKRGNDAYEVSVTPSMFIFTQSREEPYAINIDGSEEGNSSVQLSVVNDGEEQAFQIIDVVASSQNITTQYSNTSKRVWITHIANNIEKATIDITVRYGSNAMRTVTVNVFCNLIGTWQEETIGSVRTIVAQNTEYYDSQNQTAERRYEELMKSTASRLSGDISDVHDELNTSITNNLNRQQAINEILDGNKVNGNERMILRASRNTVELDFSDFEETYNTVYNNPLLSGTIEKTNLNTAFTDYSEAASDLMDAIDDIINTQPVETEYDIDEEVEISAAQKKAVEDALDAYYNAATDMRQAVEAAYVKISGMQADNAASAAKSELQDVIGEGFTAQRTVLDVMGDLHIDAMEKGNLEAMHSSLVTQWGEAYSAYAPVYNNANLTYKDEQGNTRDYEERTALQNAMSTARNSYNAVIAKINELLAIDTITSAQAYEVNATFTAFNTALQSYRTALENASNRIVNHGDSENMNYYTTFRAEYTQSEKENSAKFTAVTKALTGDGSDDDTAAVIQQRIASYKESVDGRFTTIDDGLGNVYTKSETATLVSTSISDNNGNYYNKTETANLVSQEVAAGILPTNIDNIDEWEQGTTNERAGYTYAQIKAGSYARIRTKRLFPSTDELCVIFSSNGEVNWMVAFIYFTSSKVVCSTVWSGWKTMSADGTGNKRIAVDGPSDCAYIAVLLCYNDGRNIKPWQVKDTGIAFISKQTATRSYVKQTADSVSLGVQSEIEGKLYDTGINIQGSTRTITFNAKNLNLDGTSMEWDSSNDTFQFGKLIANGTSQIRGAFSVTGGDIYMDSSSGTHKTEIHGTPLRLNYLSGGSSYGATYMGGNGIEINGSSGYSIYLKIGGTNRLAADSSGVTVYGTFVNSSDERIKNIIDHLSLLTEYFANAPLVRFTFNNNIDDRQHIGSLAQYWKSVLPETVVEDKDGMLALDYLSVSFAGVVTVARDAERLKRKSEDNASRIAALEKEVKSLGKEIADLKDEITRLKKLVDELMFNR